MNRKRDRLQVMRDILQSIQEKGGNARPTHILYKSNLSHDMMQEYLRELISRCLISEKKIKEGRSYSLEDKGYLFLEKYKSITEFLELFGL